MTTERDIWEEEEAYWEELRRRVSQSGIQWGRFDNEVAKDAAEETEDIPEAPELTPTRRRDTTLGIQSPGKRKRDRQLPRRRGTP
jgi:hypothetical protein